MTHKITDDFTLDHFIKADAALTRAEELLNELEKLIEIADDSGESDLYAGFEDFQCRVVMAHDSIKESIADYSSEPMHTETPEETGRR